MQPYENRRYDERDGERTREDEFQTDSSRGDEHSRKGDREETVNYSVKRNSSLSEDAINYIQDTKEFQKIISIVDER